MSSEKQPPQATKPDPTKAVFKLVVYFKNGSKRTLYNYHTAWNAETKKIIEDEKIGLAKLERLIIHKYKDAYKTALLYHIPSGQQIKKYCYNRLIQESAYTWFYDAPANAIRFRFTK